MLIHSSITNKISLKGILLKSNLLLERKPIHKETRDLISFCFSLLRNGEKYWGIKHLGSKSKQFLKRFESLRKKNYIYLNFDDL